MVIDHDGAVGQVRPRRAPHDAIGCSLDAPATTVALRHEAPVELACLEWFAGTDSAGHRVAVGVVGVAAAQTTGPMASRQRDRVVQEEDGRPATRLRERPAPLAVLEQAGDPQRAAMMSDDRAVVVDKAPAVAGEQTALRAGVKIAPRVDAVATGHRAR